MHTECYNSWNRPLTNIDLIRQCTIFLKTKTPLHKNIKIHFLGVYPANKLNILEGKMYTIITKNSQDLSLYSRQTFFLIINTATSNLPGLHWVCIWASPKKLEYFDSMGQQPDLILRKFLGFLSKKMYTKRTWSINSFIVQPKNTILCGHYVLMFIKYKLDSRGSLLDFVNELLSTSNPAYQHGFYSIHKKLLKFVEDNMCKEI